MTRNGTDIAETVRGHFHAAVPERIGVAVSGGGDSVALMHILHDCFQNRNVEILTATVDHGLRAKSAEEAQQVAKMAGRLGLSHDTLVWTEGPGKRNLQDAARRARYDLLTAWARDRNIPILAVAHTANDQAETVVMQLMRSAGVSGLAAMPVRRTVRGVTVLRPLLDVSRDSLRDYLRCRGIDWIEDPSNEDMRFDRIKVRKALDGLEDLGLTATALATVAQNMAKARDALDWYTFLAARELVRVKAGAIVLNQRGYRTLPEEVAHRLLSRAIRWISGSTYSPRRVPMMDAAATARIGGSATLSGCRLLCRNREIWIAREYNAVRNLTTQVGEVWDGRWRFLGSVSEGCEVRALGRSGLADCPAWRETAVPGPVLEATPSLWHEATLIAAPVAGLGKGWAAELITKEEEFFASLLSH